jgi:hypothetical protein
MILIICGPAFKLSCTTSDRSLLRALVRAAEYGADNADNAEGGTRIDYLLHLPNLLFTKRSIKTWEARESFPLVRIENAPLNVLELVLLESIAPT